MSGSTAKENRKRLAKAFGPEIAESLAELHELVQQVHNAQRVLARQMQDFERELAAVKEGRAVDKRQHGAKTDECREQLDSLEGRIKLLRADLNAQALRARKVLFQLTLRERLRYLLTGFVDVPLLSGDCDPPSAEIVRDPTPAQRGEFFAGPPAIYERTGDGPLERVK